jgi:hypothetical protein
MSAFPGADHADQALRALVLQGDPFLRASIDADRSSLVFAEGSSTAPYHAALSVSVGHVLGAGAHEKVIRVAARRVVAGVADAQAGRDWPVPCRVCEAMRKNGPATFRRYAVPSCVRETAPDPTARHGIFGRAKKKALAGLKVGQVARVSPMFCHNVKYNPISL